MDVSPLYIHLPLIMHQVVHLCLSRMMHFVLVFSPATLCTQNRTVAPYGPSVVNFLGTHNNNVHCIPTSVAQVVCVCV